MTLKASEQGLARIRQARMQKGWAIDDERWLVAASNLLEPNIWQKTGFFAAGIAQPTWRRFLSGKRRIRVPAFQAFCEVLGLNWQEICEPQPNLDIEEPVSLTSPFYVERVPYESQCYEAVLQPGALIRVKGPQQMGKTWLMERILEQARNQSYRSLNLSFNLADSTVFTDLRTFLRWFCVNIGDSLELPNRLSDYWDDIRGSNSNSTRYFEQYLLANSNSPLALALDNVDRVFEQPKEIVNNFCCLLRGWYDKARGGNRSSAIWRQLRLVIVHSTEVYGSLDINHSPLGGVGLAVELPEFSREQVKDLVQRHLLDWNTSQINQLMAMVGGHPYLVREGLDYIDRHQITLEELLQLAPTEAGPYSDHLRRYLWTFRQHPSLATAFRQVVTTTSPVQIEPFLAFKLYSMGLVNLQGNSVMPRCGLYRRYFCDLLKADIWLKPDRLNFDV